MKTTQKVAAALLVAALLAAFVAKIWWRMQRTKADKNGPAGSTLLQKGQSFVKRLMPKEQPQPQNHPEPIMGVKALGHDQLWQRLGLRQVAQANAASSPLSQSAKTWPATHRMPHGRPSGPAFGTETIFVAIVARYGQESLAVLTTGHLFATCARPMRVWVGLVLVAADDKDYDEDVDSADHVNGKRSAAAFASPGGAGRGWVRNSEAWESALNSAKRFLFPPSLGHLLDHNVRLFPLRAREFRGHGSAMRLAFDHLYRGESYVGTLRVGRLPSQSWDVVGLAELAALVASGVHTPALTARCAAGPDAPSAPTMQSGVPSGLAGLASQLARLGNVQQTALDAGPRAPSAFVCFERWTPFGTPHMRTRPCVGRPRRPHPALAWSSDWSLAPARVLIDAAPWDPWLEHLGPLVVDWTMTARMWLAGADPFAPSGAIVLGRLPAISWSVRLRIGQLALAAKTQDREEDNDGGSSNSSSDSDSNSHGGSPLRNRNNNNNNTTVDVRQSVLGSALQDAPTSYGRLGSNVNTTTLVYDQLIGTGYVEHDEHALAYDGLEHGNTTRAADDIKEIEHERFMAERVRRRAVQLRRNAALRRLAVVLGIVADPHQTGVFVEPLYRIQDRVDIAPLGRTVAEFAARCGMDWRTGAVGQAAFAGMVSQSALSQTMGTSAAIPFHPDDVVSKYGSWNQFYDATGYIPEAITRPDRG